MGNISVVYRYIQTINFIGLQINMWLFIILEANMNHFFKDLFKFLFI